MPDARGQKAGTGFLGSAAGGPCDPATATGGRRRLLLFTAGFFERGCVEEAARLARNTPADEEDDREERLPVLLELVGAGRENAWLVKEAREMLVEARPRWALWSAAAGSLAAVPGRPRMERLLAEVDARWPHSWKTRLARALWLSRCGRFPESLVALARVQQQTFTDDSPLASIAEILSRPVWATTHGDAAARAMIARLLAEPGPGAGPAASYWEELRARICG